MRNRWIWAAALAAAGSAALWSAVSDGPEVEPPIWTEPLPAGLSPSNGGAPAGPAGPAGDEPARSIAQRQPEGVQWHLRVLDAEGRPAVGARLFAASSARWFSAADALAETDVRGHLSVRDDALPGGQLLVTASGHRSRQVSLTGRDPERLQVVPLVAGATVTLDVAGVDGAPVSGVRFALSRSGIDGSAPLGEVSEDAEFVPGADPRQAIHVAITDREGRLTCAGLTPGAYEIRPVDPLWMMLGDRPWIEAPGHRTVEVGQVHGIAVAFGDEVLSESLAYDPNPVPVNQYRASMNRAEAVLHERFPGAVCRAAWVHPRVHAEGGEAALTVFCRHAGWRVVDVPLRPVGEITEPLVVPVDRGDDRTCLVDVVFEQADGTPIDRPLVLVHAGDDGAHQGQRKTVWPGEQRLPAGTWNALPVDGFLMRALGPRRMVNLEAGGRAELRVTVPGRYRMVRIDVSGPGISSSSDRDGYASLALLDARERRVQVLPYVPLARRRVPLPIGCASTLLISRRGFAPARIDISPQPGREELVLDVALDPAAQHLARR